MIVNCKRCLSPISIRQHYCMCCGRKLKGKKIWHNIKDWFRVEYIGKYAKSSHCYGILSYTIFIVRLRFKNRKNILLNQKTIQKHNRG